MIVNILLISNRDQLEVVAKEDVKVHPVQLAYEVAMVWSVQLVQRYVYIWTNNWVEIRKSSEWLERNTIKQSTQHTHNARQYIKRRGWCAIHV